MNQRATNQRSTTPIEQVIFRWMKRNINKISTTAIHERFNIDRAEAVYMIQLFNANPNSDYKLIKTL